MLRALSEAAAAGLSPIWSLVAPFVGVLGALMTGSNTVSNIQFSTFQSEVAASAVVGILGSEGRTIRINLTPAVIYSLVVGVIGMLAIYVFVPGLF